MAANPQHFGRVTELNTAEAFAAAAHILGFPERAEQPPGRAPRGRGVLRDQRGRALGVLEQRG